MTRGEVYFPAPCLVGRYPGRPDSGDLSRAYSFGEEVVRHVAVGRAGPVVESRMDVFKPKIGFYDLVAQISADSTQRLLMPKPRLDITLCDQCKWCVQSCPMDNISMRSYPRLGDQCVRCYRCLTGCPQRAFNVNWRFGNLVAQSFYNTTFVRWFGDLEPDEHIY